MTRRSNQNKKQHVAEKTTEDSGGSTVDLVAVGGQLSQVAAALEQLERENTQLADALAHAETRLQVMKDGERALIDATNAAESEAARLAATVERRDTELAEAEAELSKVRSSRADWESMILTERDAAIEEHQAELVSARKEIESLEASLVELETALAIERQRTAPDARLVELMTTPGTSLLVDGDSVVATSWPGARPGDRRQQVVDAAQRFHKRHGVNVELVLGTAEGWDPEANYPEGLRIRVPHKGIPVSACLDQLAHVHGEVAPVVTVSSSVAEEPWISIPRAASLLGLPVPPQFIDLTEEQDLVPAMEAEK